MQKHDIFLSSISEFELILGGARTQRHQTDLEMVFRQVEVMPFDFGCGRIAADIWKNRKFTHQHIEIKDIFIASIAIYGNLWLRTFKRKAFQGNRKVEDVAMVINSWNICHKVRISPISLQILSKEPLAVHNK